ncbi:MAG: LamG domain-containing protein [Anaerolineae bacterium]|nr:LamG domain-containing protein [Anaerolineae bacterium]
MPNPPILPDITVQGPFWTARAAVLTAPLPSGIANQAIQWASHTRTIFVGSTPRSAFGYEKAYLPGTMLALCYVRSVQIGKDDTITESYRWERAANDPLPPAETVQQIKDGIQTGKLALLLLEADPQQLVDSGMGIFTCIAGDIHLDNFAPQNNALGRLYQALNLEAPVTETRWKAISHSSGFSIYGQVDLPWRKTRITIPLQLAKVLRPAGITGKADFRLTIEAERLTEPEEQALIQAWRSLSIYLNPKNPLNDLTTPATNPTPNWITLEIADPLSVPRLYWEITEWEAQPEKLPLHFDRQEINVLLSDQQPYDTAHPPTSLARITPDDVVMQVDSANQKLEVRVTAESKRALTGGTIQYQWNTQQLEQFAVSGLEVAFDPVETPEFVRDNQSLPIPQWFPGEDSQTVSPAVVWGFMPLEDGWAQFPIPNLTEQIYLDSDLSNFGGRATQSSPALLQGAVSIGNDLPEVLAAHSDEQPWNLTITDAKRIEGSWILQGSMGDDYELEQVTLDITAPETILNGLFWLSTGRPSAEDALPDLVDWVFGLQRIPLKTVQAETALFPAVVTFGLNDFAFTGREGNGKRSSAAITGWSFIYQVKNDVLTQIVNARVLPDNTFAALLPLIWRRHPTLPMIQALPLTQSKSPPNFPNASRQLVPFELPVDAQNLPHGWAFGVAGDNGAARWPQLIGTHQPAQEWYSAFDLPLVALSLPGMVLDPNTNPDETGLERDPSTMLPMQYRFDLPYTDQINALAQLPKIPRNPEEVSPLPDSPPPEPPKPLTRETLTEYWTSLSTRASLAAADAIEAFRKQGNQVFIQHLIEPMIWPVRPETNLTVYPGALTIANANGGDPASIELKHEDGLEGISGTFSADANGNLHRLTDSPNGDNYHITAGSMAAFREIDGSFRDQRGLVRAATSGTGEFLRTPIRLNKAIGSNDTYELTSTLLPLDLAIPSGQNWHFWFRDLPMDATTFLFDRAMTLSDEAKEKDFDVNDPDAMGREHNYLTGYEWRLGEDGQTADFLVLYGLHFYPLTLEKVIFIEEGIQQIEMIGRLQLPVDPALELTDLSNAVRLTFKTAENGELLLDEVAIESVEGEWPLALVDGEISDAPILRWKQARLNDNRSQLDIGDVELHYFLFDVEWSIQLEMLSFPPPANKTVVEQIYNFDSNPFDPLYPSVVNLTLDMENFLHEAALMLNIQLGERAVDGLLARYTFTEGSDPARVYDVSGVGTPLNLKIKNTAAVQWVSGSGLKINMPTTLSSEGSASKITEAVRDTNELSFEAWILPDNIAQNGALAVIAKGGGVLNTTLSQNGAAFDVQLKTLNETATTSGGNVTADWLHVVYTRDVWGMSRLYINGTEQVSKMTSGNLDVWDATLPLTIANNFTENQPWLGTYRMLAIYNRALTPAEVAQNFQLQLKATQRAAFQTEVKFPLVREKHTISWKNPVLFDDLHLQDTSHSLLYTDKALQFNWQQYELGKQDAPLQLLPGMAVDAQSKHVPGFAVVTFDVIASFKLDAVLEDELENATMTVKLQRAFEDNGVSISRNASIQGNDQIGWEITDGTKEYRVKKTRNSLSVFMGIPALPMRSAFVETLIICHWGDYLGEANLKSTLSNDMIFGSSAGDMTFGYTANWRDADNTWDEAFLLNGFIEIKNLISWPLEMEYLPETPRLTLPAARNVDSLNHTRHSLRVLFNQHEIPATIPVVGEDNLLFNFAHDKPWQFLAVVEHQLVDITTKENEDGYKGGNDRRWTALQEVRFTSPKTFRKFLETPKRGSFISPLFLDEKISATITVNGGDDDVNEDGNTFANNQQTLWLGTGGTPQKSFAGLRFNNISLPRGARITGARLQLITAVDSPALLEIEVSGDAVDNSAAFSTTNRPSGRTPTQAKVKIKTTGQWNRTSIQTLDGLMPIIQEIINRSGWRSGNSLSLIVRGTSTAANQRKVVGSFNAAPAAAPKLILEYTVPNDTLVNYGYFGLEMRNRLAGKDNPELAKIPSNTFLVEASAPHWIKQTPAPDVGPTALQYLPNGTQMGILSNPQDYTPSSYLDPLWLLLTMPFLGRLQNQTHDYLEDDSSEAGALQIDPVLNIDRKRAQTSAQALPDVPLAFANWGDDAPIQISISAFDTDVARLFARLDPLSLEENWFRLQNPLTEPQPDSLQSVTAALPNASARLSRSIALRRAFDSFRQEYPPALPPENYQLPEEVNGEDLIWREDSLMVTQGISSITASHIPPYNWHLIGMLIQNSDFSQETDNAAPRRYPAATIIPARLKVDGQNNVTPVSFAVSPYLGLEFRPGEVPVEPRVISSELLCLDRNAKVLLPVASYLQEVDQEKGMVNFLWQDWAQKTHLRLSPDSPVAVLRFRQINRSGGEALLTTTYTFEVVSELQLAPQLVQRVFRIRSSVETLRFRQGQYGGYEMPDNPQAFEIAPPQTTGVQPLYLTEPPHEADWPWGLSALRLSIQYTENKDGVVGNVAESNTDKSTLWWQSPQYALQFRSTQSARPAASLPRKFRARAIKSLLPVLPEPPMPEVNLQTLGPDEAQAAWQPVLPGSFRYLVTGSRPGGMFVFRNQLLRQSDLSRNGAGETGKLMVSGSIPVQHRMPRSVPLPPNTRKLYALQPWASYFEPEHNALITTAPADEAFLAEFDGDPARRLQIQMVQPANGAIPAQWDGKLLVEMCSQESALRLLSWGIEFKLLNNKESYPYAAATPLPLFSLQNPVTAPGNVPEETRNEFADRGITLSNEATIISDTVWQITADITAGKPKVYSIYRENNLLYVVLTQSPDPAEVGWKFSLDLSFENTLTSNAGEAVTAVRDEFQNRGQPLSDKPGINIFTVLQIINGAEAYILQIEGNQINVYHNLYSISLINSEDAKKITAGNIALVAQVRHIKSTRGFYQTLTFPLRFADQTLLPLPLEPYFIHFEDPEYNRQLASSSAHASGNVKEIVGDEEVLHTVTLSADRKQYNPDSHIALRYDWDDDRTIEKIKKTKVKLSRVSKDGVVNNLNAPNNELFPAELKLYDLAALIQKIPDLQFLDGDRLQIEIEVNGEIIVLQTEIVSVPVTPVPQAAYGLLHRQQVDEQMQVECSRFAWSPEATRIELVCPDDLRTEIVRRRAVFHWNDSARPARDNRYAIQKITFSGSTHFPDFNAE